MQNITNLIQLSKDLTRKYPCVFDIVLFGSSVRGKLMPGDRDICVILRAKKKEAINEAKKIFVDNHISLLDLDTIFDPQVTLWKTLIHEGYSLTKEKYFSELLGYSSKSLFWYDLKKLTYTEKIRYYYALVGRGKQQGMLQKTNSQSIGKGVILVPSSSEDEIKEFFKTWNISFNRRMILLS